MEIRPLWIALAVVAIVLIVFALGRVTDELRPEPVAVWVGVQPEGESRAIVGPVVRPAGTKFQLQAVLEARSVGGDRVLYTAAEELTFLGEQVPTEELETWSRGGQIKVLWFSVEGTPPFLEVGSSADFEMLRFHENFRADFAQSWTVTGDIRPSLENFVPGNESIYPDERFGVQRFRIRMEFFGPSNRLVPKLRLESWGASELLEHASDFSSLLLTLPGSLRIPSTAFGLNQVEWAETPDEELVAELKAWKDRGVVFSKIQVLADWLEEQGTTWDKLVWTGVELAATDTRGVPGDLLRVGDRVVWLYQDRGVIGRLDYQDLCLDFEQGARVLELGNVFAGDGLVEWSSTRGERND